LPVQEYSEERWSRHVLQDLEPYVCLDKACLPARTAFASKEDWTTHIHQEHALLWKCPLHHLVDKVVPSQDMLFTSQVELDQHLVKEHGWSSSRARTIARRSVVSDPNRVFQTCPFCTWMPTFPSSNIENSTTRDETLAEHTADHLMSLSSIILSAGEDYAVDVAQVAESDVSNPEINQQIALKLDSPEIRHATSHAIKAAPAEVLLKNVRPQSPVERITTLATTVASVSKGLITLIDDTRHYDKTLEHDLTTFRTVINRVQETLNAEDIRTMIGEGDHVFDAIGVTFQDCLDFVEELSQSVKKSRSKRTSMVRLVNTKYRSSDRAALQRRIIDSTRSVQVALQVITL
jgi:hypothetical protein